MGRKLNFLVLFLLCTHVGFTNVVDSLKSEIKKQEGAARILSLGELSYHLMYDNPHLAIQYGSMAVAEALVQPDSLVLAMAYNDLSMPYLITGKFDSVILLNQMAFKIRIRNGKLLLAAANLSKIGQAYYELGDFKQSLLAQAKACFIYEKMGDSAKLVQMSNNLGALFEKNKAYHEALRWYKKAQLFGEALGDERGVVLAKINESIVQRKLGNFQKAERLMLGVKPFIDVRAYANERAKYYESFGVLYRASNRPKEGQINYLKALEAYEEQGDEPGLANVNRNLGYCYVDLKQFDVALRHFEMALFYAQKNKLSDQFRLILYDLYEWYKRNNNDARALFYLESHKSISDSIYTAETNDLIQKYSAKYELERFKSANFLKEKQLMETKANLQNQTNLLIGSIGISVILFLALLVYRLYDSQKKNKLMQQNLVAMNEERLRISRDLHDNLGSELTWIASEIDVQAFSEGNKMVQNNLNELSNKLRSAMLSLRETIWAIHQDKSTVEQLLNRFKQNTQKILELAHVTLVLPEVLPNLVLTPMQTLHVYRMLKEATNNVVKYAQAKHIFCGVEHHNDQLILFLKDDGIGFNVDNNLLNGYGLANMKGRAAENNMQLEIKSSPGNGTEIRIVVPLIKQMQNLV